MTVEEEGTVTCMRNGPKRQAVVNSSASPPPPDLYLPILSPHTFAWPVSTLDGWQLAWLSVLPFKPITSLMVVYVRSIRLILHKCLPRSSVCDLQLNFNIPYSLIFFGQVLKVSHHVLTAVSQQSFCCGVSFKERGSSLCLCLISLIIT